MGIDPQIGTLFQSEAVAGIGNALTVPSHSYAVDHAVGFIIASLTLIYLCVSGIRSWKITENADNLIFLFYANIAISVLNIGLH